MANGRQVKRNGRARRRNGNVSSGPSRGPQTCLKRTFREFRTIELNNSTGTGLNQYAYYSKYLNPTPENVTGFKDAQQTFEFWRINKFRVRVQPGYNAYNQTYNTVNLDALAAMQIWTAADLSFNETISGVSITSYNNAKVHTLSLNGIKTVANTICRINQENITPRTILPGTTWLDTSQDMSSTSNNYSGVQFFAKMDGVSATNYLPRIQLILEYDVEFKQPAFQNRPSTFESSIVGSKLAVIPDASLPDEVRVYECVSFTLNSTGGDYRFERVDGQAGSLNYDIEEMYNVYFKRTSGQYFSDRDADYTGPIPRKPVDWTPPALS
jgi:hypothetical protein